VLYLLFKMWFFEHRLISVDQIRIRIKRKSEQDLIRKRCIPYRYWLSIYRYGFRLMYFRQLQLQRPFSMSLDEKVAEKLRNSKESDEMHVLKGTGAYTGQCWVWRLF
jgi:hypothetical protein